MATDVERAQQRVGTMQEKLDDEKKDLAKQQERVNTAEENLKEAQAELKKEEIREAEEKLKQLKDSVE